MNNITIALAGNPNAGKTTLFNALTGARQHVGNWPGVTVEKKEGTLKHAGQEIHVVDLPGTYSLTAYSLEEIIARNFIVESAPDVIIDVVDASNLERNLYLSVQLLEMGVKMIIALNMIDVAEGRNINIDYKRLSELFGVPIVPTNGKKRIGIEQLLDTAIDEAGRTLNNRPKIIHYGTEIEEELEKIETRLQKTNGCLAGLSRQWLSLKLLEGDQEIAKKFDCDPERDRLFKQIETGRKHLDDIFADPPEILLTDARYGFISGAMRLSVQTEAANRIHLSESIDKVLTNRLLGPIILAAVLYTLYVFTFQGSQPLVEAFGAFFKWLGQAASTILPEGLLKSLIVSGIINGVGGVLGFTPLIAFMFFAIAILEDTGYMARIAFMLDRVLRGFGLHGASMLALMVSGGLAGGCAVPGIMATRTMKEPKERLVTMLVAPLMNCGAKLPVYALLIGAFFSTGKAQMMFVLTIISWGLALFAAKIIRSTLLAGPSAPFVLELPPYRVPTVRGLLIHTWERTWMYVKKAGTVILAVSILLWAAMTFPTLPEDQAKTYDSRRAELTAAFLQNPAAAKYIPSESDLNSLDDYLKESTFELPANLKPLGAAVKAAEKGEKPKPELAEITALYKDYADKKDEIEAERAGVALMHTIGGRMGMALEKVLWPLGFDWRTNVALVGGFAAKEVVVATLGTAYSLGEVKPREADSLSEKLRKEPGWNALQAMTLIMFVMLYNPCLTTLVVIRRESGKWRWTLFAMVYTTCLAYGVAFIVHSVGTLLHLGVS
jgi:ferrous iron transport protein B